MVFAILWGALFLSANRKLEDLKCEIRKKGLPASPLELDRWYIEAIPGQNSADLYRDAFAAMKSAEDSVPICGLGSMPPNDEKMSDELLTVSSKHLEENAKCLELLLQACQMRSCRFPASLDKGPGTLLPHVSSVRGASRLLSLSATVEAERGNLEKSANSMYAVLSNSACLNEEPMMISFLVKIACDSIAITTLNRCMSRADYDDQTLANFAKLITLSISDNRRSFERGIYGDWACLSEFSYYDAGVSHFTELPESLSAFAKFLHRSSGFDALDKIRDWHFREGIVKLGLAPYDKKAIDAFESRIIGKHRYLNRFLYPASSYSVSTYLIRHKTRFEAQATVALVSLAVRRFHLKHGKLPETLSELVPEFLDSLPSDPFDGAPLRYKKGIIKLKKEQKKENGTNELEYEANGYIVYSVGENLTDDGASNAGSQKSYNRGDICFPVILDQK